MTYLNQLYNAKNICSKYTQHNTVEPFLQCSVKCQLALTGGT